MKARAAHAALPAQDMERAKKFYGEALGLTASVEQPEGVMYEVGNTRILVFPSSGRPSGQHTQTAFEVEDIEAAVADLKSRGVVFEEYDAPGLQTVDSVATTGPVKGAWFKDTEGNLLGLVQFPEGYASS